MKAIQNQMVKAKKNKTSNVLSELKGLLKKFGFNVELSKCLLAKGRKPELKYPLPCDLNFI